MDEISDSPVCEITPEGDVKLLIKDVNHSDLKTRTRTTNRINGLTLNFRYDNDPKSDLVNFYGEDHKIGFRFYYASKTSGISSARGEKRRDRKSGSKSRGRRR